MGRSPPKSPPFGPQQRLRDDGGAARAFCFHAYFFETLVRIHRAGEGADFTGLKSAGQIGPPIAAADKAIEAGNLQPVAKRVSERMEKGLHGHFDAVMAKKKYSADDVEAGRVYSSAYVEFVHYVERLYEAADVMAPDQAQNLASGHTH